MTAPAPRRRRPAAAILALGLVALAAGACSDRGSALSPEAERGRRVYQAHCAGCHAIDPSRPGAVGPPVKGSARALLEAKVLRGEYPPGHVAKRATRIMPLLPSLAPEIPALAEYLR